MRKNSGSRRRRFGLVVTYVTCLSFRSLTSSAQDPGDSAPTLSELVERYFREEDSREREKLTALIREAASDDIAKVAEAVRRARLWEPPADRKGTFTVPVGGAAPIAVTYDLPDDYDGGRAHPLLLCTPEEGRTPRDIIHSERITLESFPEFIMICPDRLPGGGFQRDAGSDGNFRKFLRGVRQQVHTDTQRTFVVGSFPGTGAEWMIAIAYADEFVVAMSIWGRPRMPYPQQLCPLLLGNLRGVQTLAVSFPADAPDVEMIQRVNAAGRRIEEIAKSQGLPISTVTLPPEGRVPVEFEHGVNRIWESRRSLDRVVSHWFRYPDQGRAGWLRATGFPDDLWIDEQISILPAAGTDADAFITEVLKSKLCYIGGRLEGNELTVETRRSTSLVIALYEGMVDFSRPVVVRVNGVKRHDGVVKPSIATLLEGAYEDWDFQRLVFAKIGISIQSRTP